MRHSLVIAAFLGTAAAQAVQPCDVRDYSFAYCLSDDGLGLGNVGFLLGPGVRTLEGCAGNCKDENSRYFWYGISDTEPLCICSPSVNSMDPADPALCNTPCPDNPNQICGGQRVGSLYVNNCFEPNPNVATLGDFAYDYCVDGVIGETLNTVRDSTNVGFNASLIQCAGFCRRFGYFAIQSAETPEGPGAACVCGESIVRARYEPADSRCTAACPSGGGFCGNPTNGVNVYVQSTVPFTPASRSCTSLVTTTVSRTTTRVTNTVTETSTETATLEQSTVTSTCATSITTATVKPTMTATTTKTVTKSHVSTCYKTTTRTVTSSCLPPKPKTRYARDEEHGMILARQELTPVRSCTVSSQHPSQRENMRKSPALTHSILSWEQVSNGRVIFESTSTRSISRSTTETETITTTTTTDPVVVCVTSSSTITVTSPAQTTETVTSTHQAKPRTTTVTKTVTSTKYPRHAKTCKAK
ncbi:hypothetical protein CERZMDRAFT_107903 [Cercospora zeae-maydis SCOH1-5]|uniref:WSC domain-containing protein n=1 Tax=Cercospora zeae-maydis SCOH1-5 TaxID=717836 RepID=A0A6A6F0W1_9PEZI|nr:hypothetical protein CERZMDRAFT_107903 [Cercospora zeae-maydis SCOH1-5]